METVINSEEDYQRVTRLVNQLSEHPLFGENPTDVLEYERTIALLDDWRKKHPERTSETGCCNKALLADRGFWEFSDSM